MPFYGQVLTHGKLSVAGFVSFANLLHLPLQEERDQMKIVQAVQSWLSTHTRWLLILDNADDLRLSRDFLPHANYWTCITHHPCSRLWRADPHD